MSNVAHPASFPLVQEEDRLSARRAILITVAALFVIMLALALSAWLMWLATGSVTASVLMDVQPGTTAPREIGGVKQTDIRIDRFGERLFAAQRRELARYGWVSREQGVVTIPIGEAMRLVAQGEQPQ